ncbi:hypothetical protein ABZT43_50995, partial [Streptomyces sp. NPDC005349]
VRLTRWLLSPLPTFLLWRRMKLWELRSYEAVIKLEQERLVYQARLHSRFGRAWRRKAPVESLMPLRLARYGVPLAQTAPSGLAAAGIEPALLPPVPTAPELVAPSTELNAPTTRAGQSEREEESPWFQAEASQQVRDEGGYDPTFSEHGQAGAQPVAALQSDPFGAALAEAHAAGTKDTPGSIPEEEPAAAVASGFAGQAVTDPSVTAGVGTGAVTDRGVAEVLPVVAAPAVEPVAAPAAPVTDAPDPAVIAAQATASGGVPGASVTAGAAGEAMAWEATVTDTGEATARLPEQQAQEPVPDPVQQDILTVAGWLEEADAEGTTLSGAEVARRLGVSPKTGQRRVIAATKHREDQQRQQGRAHLRSVNT